jgi:hypothetical protein
MQRIEVGISNSTDTCVYCFLLDVDREAVCEVIDSHENRLPVCWDHAQSLKVQEEHSC